MKTILLIVLSCSFVVTAISQSPITDPENAKTINAPDPVFPDEAKDRIYGQSIRVTVEVNKSGKVTKAEAFGPLAPCTNLKDPAVEAMRKAALSAAKETVFVPFQKEGKPVEAKLNLTYYLRPRSTPLHDEDRMTIFGGVLNNKAVSLARPEYPANARANRVSGVASAQVLVGEDGRVISAGANAGHRDFYQSVTQAACGARFKPTTLQGKPAKVIGVLVYNYVA